MTASSARPASIPNRPPPTNDMKNSLSPEPMSSSRAVPIIPSKTANSAIAAASLSRASPSTRRVNRAGAPMSRKMAMTAAGSVVDTTEPSSRQTTNETRPNGQSANDGEQQDRRRIFQHPPDVGGDPGLEHEQGQKDIDKDAGADWEVHEDLGKCICPPEPAQMRHQGRKPSQGQANHAEQNGRRQRQISSQWL